MTDHAIIFNPTAGGVEKAKQGIDIACKYLDDLKVSYKIFATDHAQHAIELARQCAKDGYRVIAAGGDGTHNETLHGVITSKTGALCGFIPLGSGNDIPGAIGIRPDIKRACEIIAEGKSSKADIGLGVTDSGIERYFLGIGSQGFDAEVARRANLPGASKNYNAIVMKTVFSWKSKEIKVTMDNEIYEGLANLTAVGNGPTYGGWMYVCQRAKVNDGIFHISIVDIGKLKLLMQFKRMYKAKLLPHPNVYEYTSKKVRIEMKDPKESNPYYCQVDGEVLGHVPVNYECIKDGYEFIRPEIDEVAEAFKEKYGRYFYECEY
jgi:diacylglycerol kinase (ATP)